MINIDNNMENSDWTKSRSWDLPTTLYALLAVIGSTVEEVEHFLTLPAAKPMPADLQVSLTEYLEKVKAEKK
jgi:hypothetical protein